MCQSTHARIPDHGGSEVSARPFASHAFRVGLNQTGPGHFEGGKRDCQARVLTSALGLLRHMPSELDSIKPARALQGMKGHLWEQVYLPTQLQGRLLWSPGNTGPIGVSRQVLTVHDMASLDHPEWFERKFALWYAALLPPLIHRVRAIITVSHFSKERIIRLTGVEPERVHVIFNGVDR